MTNLIEKLEKYLADVAPLYRNIEEFAVDVVAYRNRYFYTHGLLTKTDGVYDGTYDGHTMIGVWYVPNFEDDSRIWEDTDGGVGVLATGKDREGWTCDSCFIPANMFEEDYKERIHEAAHDALAAREEHRKHLATKEAERLAARTRIFRGEVQS